MKTKISIFMAKLFLMSLLSGCEETVVEVDNLPPAVPRGLVSVTADERVYLYWYPNTEPDLDGYNIYSSETANGSYFRIGTTRSANFIDSDVYNGETWFYAVTAFDYEGNESDLSTDLVFDTPRPEGLNVRLYDYHAYPFDSGYDFSDYVVQQYDLNSTDIVYEYDTVVDAPFIIIGNVNTDIQDFGYTESLDDIDYSPEDGWSQLGYVEVIQGHSYIVWTYDNHFAKFRVVDWTRDRVTIDWAYQVDEGNRELRKRTADNSNGNLKALRFGPKGGEAK